MIRYTHFKTDSLARVIYIIIHLLDGKWDPKTHFTSSLFILNIDNNLNFLEIISFITLMICPMDMAKPWQSLPKHLNHNFPLWEREEFYQYLFPDNPFFAKKTHENQRKRAFMKQLNHSSDPHNSSINHPSR